MVLCSLLMKAFKIDDGVADAGRFLGFESIDNGIANTNCLNGTNWNTGNDVVACRVIFSVFTG